jgi:benzodiazapine receptor
MRNAAQYSNYRKPSWAPPSWLFAPVWTVLYILIAISFGYVGYRFIDGSIEFIVVIPFVLNLVFNFLFTTIQFKLKNYTLAAIDVVLVLLTLIWALVAIAAIAPWVVYINIPYLLWASFASVLQVTVTVMNRK